MVCKYVCSYNPAIKKKLYVKAVQNYLLDDSWAKIS